MPGRVLRLNDLAFRYLNLIIGVGLTWSAAFAVIALFYQLELYGDGAMFSYAVQSGMFGRSTGITFPAERQSCLPCRGTSGVTQH